MRRAEVHRKTLETEVRLSLSLDGSGKGEILTGCGFLDHMLRLLAAHGCFDLTLRCQGDREVDDHHTVEDTGLCLGRALRAALGDAGGVRRYGSAVLPMDEALILCAVDLSGRGLLTYDLSLPSPRVGSFDTELAEEFFAALAREAGITLHLRQLCGANAHHIIEGAFKAFARALREAVSFDPGRGGEIPSTKGTLS